MFNNKSGTAIKHYAFVSFLRRGLFIIFEEVFGLISLWIAGQLKHSVHNLLAEAGGEITEKWTLDVEQPSHLEHGDYSTNIAMKLAKLLRKPPLVIAHDLKERLEQESSLTPLIERMEVAPPGFLNLYVDWEEWGKREFVMPLNPGEKVVIEHTSINPNKSAHIGHLRNSCIGDTLVRLLRRVGYHVEVHNYIDNLGNQLADTLVGLLHLPHQQTYARFGDYCWDLYAQVNQKYRLNPELLEERTAVLHAIEQGNTNQAWLGMVVAERIVREHLEEMAAFDIGYDLLVWESDIVREGFWEVTFDLLVQTGNFYQETEGKLKGCWVLRQDGAESAENVDREAEFMTDKVLVRSNGILTYTAKDIAYHLWKFGLMSRSFKYKPFADKVGSTSAAGVDGSYGKADIVLTVIDERQSYPQEMVKQALSVLGYTDQVNRLRHVGYGVVSLSPAAARELGIDTTDGKSSYAMSGRQGIGIKVTELLDRMEGIIESKRSEKTGVSSRSLAAAAIRYYLLRFGLLTEVVFDLEQATEISGNTGIYLMYAHARSARVLHKAQEEGIALPQQPYGMKPIEKAEHALLRHLATWQDTLLTAAEEMAPHVLCNYAHELALLFNNFYGACPILKGTDSSKANRLWLTKRFKETMGEALAVLGLPAPDRM